MVKTSRPPIWLLGIAGALILLGCYYFFKGSLNFLDNRGDIAAPILRNTDQAVVLTSQTSTATAPIPTRTPAQTCLDFRVNVIKARVRECPKDTCNTVGIYDQYAVLCVYGDAPGAPDWYQVNLSPNDPIPQIAYVNQSVVKPLKPTPRPSATSILLPTVTAIPIIFGSNTTPVHGSATQSP